MATALLAFICGFIAYLLVEILASRLSGETEFSLPTTPLIVGIICSSSAHYLGAWATVGIFLLLTLARAREVASDRKMLLRCRNESKDNKIL